LRKTKKWVAKEQTAAESPKHEVKKREPSAEQMISFKNKLFARVVNQTDLCDDDNSNIEEAFRSDNHWKATAGFIAFKNKIQQMRE